MPDFLLSVLEGFVDGILILNTQQEVLYANTPGTQLCQKFNSPGGAALPSEVWQCCTALQDSRDLYGERPLTLESELTPPDGSIYRMRVQWIDLQQAEQSCILVRLEDQKQSLQSLAVSEAKQYGLTPREAEVWSLKRCNLTRKEIAEQLYITIDTVKKHLGNIQTKRQAYREGWC